MIVPLTYILIIFFSEQFFPLSVNSHPFFLIFPQPLWDFFYLPVPFSDIIHLLNLSSGGGSGFVFVFYIHRRTHPTLSCTHSGIQKCVNTSSCSHSGIHKCVQTQKRVMKVFKLLIKFFFFPGNIYNNNNNEW